MCLLLRMNFLKNCLKIVKKKKLSVTVYGAVSRNPEIPAIPASPNNTATVSVSLAGSKI